MTIASLQASTCRIVLLIGLISMLLPLGIMCSFDDDKCLGLPSEALQYVVVPCCTIVTIPHMQVYLAFSRRPIDCAH